MAPQPLLHRAKTEEELYAKVPQGYRARAEEASFVSKVQSSRPFLRLLGLLSKQSGLPVDELQVSTQELVRCCWNEADKVLLDPQQRFVCKAENEQLRKKLNACNRSAMKQISLLTHGTAPEGKFGDDSIMFYEPLQYLDADTRELVLELVVEKLRQLEMGNLPASLVEALAERARAGPLIAGGSQADQLKSAIEQLHDGLEDLKETRAQLADAEELIKNMREANDGALDNQRELEQLRAECEVQREAHAIELARLEEENSKALDDNYKLSIEVEQAREAGNDASEQIKAAYEELQAKEALRRTLQVSEATQTMLEGPVLEEQRVTIRRQKVMLEELQMKLKEVLEVMKRKGMSEEVAEVIDEMGLEEVIAKRTVFERLYDDAAKRAERLDKLRGALAVEREKLVVVAEDRRTSDADRLENAERDEFPVLDAVGQSNLRGLQTMFRDLAAREAGSNGISSSSALHPRQALQQGPLQGPLPPSAAPRPPSPKPGKPPQPSEPFWVCARAVGRVQDDARRAPSRLKSSASTPDLPTSPLLRRGAGTPLAPAASRDVHKHAGHSVVSSQEMALPAKPKRLERQSGAGIDRMDAALAPLDKVLETYSTASPGGCIVRRRPRRLLV